MRKWILIISTAVVIIAGLVFVKDRPYRSIEAAMTNANISYDNIIEQLVLDDFIVIFYTEDVMLYAGLVEKTWLGYKWGFGAGSDHFQQNDTPISWSSSHLSMQDERPEMVPIVFGVVHDDTIEAITVQYGLATVAANILTTSRGRIWYSIATQPFNSSPQLSWTFNDGTSKEETL